MSVKYTIHISDEEDILLRRRHESPERAIRVFVEECVRQGKVLDSPLESGDKKIKVEKS